MAYTGNNLVEQQIYANAHPNEGTSATQPNPAPTVAPAPTTPPVNTAQPNPATVNATPTTNPTGQISGTLPGQTTPTTFTSADVAKQYGATLSNNQAALNTAKASGPAPQDAAAASTAITAAQKQNPPAPDMTVANNTLANDKGYQKLLADATTAMHTVTQGQTLLDQYKQMETDAGIPALNTELLSTKSIIDGTEDDIRKEVQAAGGFATNSQVMALSDARNKTLIKSYNDLLATKQNAENQINTMIGLAGQDKQNAIAAANEQMNIDTQLNDYAMKFQNNAQEAYKNVVNAVGYSGLVNSLLASDPSGNSLNLAAQTLGIDSFELQNIGQQEESAKTLAQIQPLGLTTPFAVDATGTVINTQTGYKYTSEADFAQKTGTNLQQAIAGNQIASIPQIQQQQITQQNQLGQLDIAQKEANLNKTNADISNVNNEIYNRNQTNTPNSPNNANQPGFDSQGNKYTIQSATSEINNELKGGYIQGNKTISSSTFNQMKSWWTSQGLKGTDFDNQFYGLIDKSDNKTTSPGYWKNTYNLG